MGRRRATAAASATLRREDGQWEGEHDGGDRGQSGRVHRGTRGLRCRENIRVAAVLRCPDCRAAVTMQKKVAIATVALVIFIHVKNVSAPDRDAAVAPVPLAGGGGVPLDSPDGGARPPRDHQGRRTLGDHAGAVQRAAHPAGRGPGGAANAGRARSAARGRARHHEAARQARARGVRPAGALDAGPSPR